MWVWACRVGRSLPGPGQLADGNQSVGAGCAPSYEPRPLVRSNWRRDEPLARVLLAEFPDMPATMVAERIGRPGSIAWFRENVAEGGRRTRCVEPADHLGHRPGESVQCDLWFPLVAIELGGGQLRPPRHRHEARPPTSTPVEPVPSIPPGPATTPEGVPGRWGGWPFMSWPLLRLSSSTHLRTTPRSRSV